MLAGESTLTTAPRPYIAMFQSTPAIAGGRIFDIFSIAAPIHAVSIHARHCWRANPHETRTPQDHPKVSIHARHCWRANPWQRTQVARAGHVSIHARHCWRANPSMGHTMTPLIRVSIHARHCWRANPCTGAAPAPLCNCFNPRPPLLAGESRHCLRGVLRSSGFNPRPPLLAGESRMCCGV